jgi:hypothetical protein
MQSKQAKQREAAGELEHVFGPPGILKGKLTDAGASMPTAEEQPRERRRWPMSRGARAIVEATAAAFKSEQERFQQAELDRRRRISEAMALDDVPELGDEFAGAVQQGDEWIEVLPEEAAQMQAQVRARSG